jgi:hypothetical protein
MKASSSGVYFNYYAPGHLCGDEIEVFCFQEKRCKERASGGSRNWLGNEQRDRRA